VVEMERTGVTVLMLNIYIFLYH